MLGVFANRAAVAPAALTLGTISLRYINAEAFACKGAVTALFKVYIRGDEHEGQLAQYRSKEVILLTFSVQRDAGFQRSTDDLGGTSLLKGLHHLDANSNDLAPLSLNLI